MNSLSLLIITLFFIYQFLKILNKILIQSNFRKIMFNNIGQYNNQYQDIMGFMHGKFYIRNISLQESKRVKLNSLITGGCCIGFMTDLLNPVLDQFLVIYFFYKSERLEKFLTFENYKSCLKNINKKIENKKIYNTILTNRKKVFLVNILIKRNVISIHLKIISKQFATTRSIYSNIIPQICKKKALQAENGWFLSKNIKSKNCWHIMEKI